MMMTSINIQLQLKRIDVEIHEAKKKALNRRIILDIDKPTFNVFLEKNIDKLIFKSGKTKGFQPDDNAVKLFHYLYKYVTLDKFPDDLDKGILVAGSFGIGKTLIMTAFFNMINDFKIKNVLMINAKILAYLIAKDHMEFKKYSKGILFIDDLGKEATNINTFGTVTNPIADLITVRYEKNALTFATGNMKLESYEKNYGGSIYDRMKAMFNIIELEGKSKR
jgi:DNA replication protein DnaC